jgi:predicted permease
MLESTPPPAMQCMIFCQLFAQDAERPLGKVLVATYVASLVTLTAWIALFLSLLSAG